MMSTSLIEKPPSYETVTVTTGENSNNNDQRQNSASWSVAMPMPMPIHEISIESMTPIRNPYSNSMVEILRKEPNGNDKWYKKNYIILTLSVVNFALIIWIICLHASSGSAVDPESGIHSMGNTTYPRFFDEKNYQGAFYTAHPNWENEKCINLPRWFKKLAMSIQTGAHCLEVCEAENCSLRNICEKVFQGSYSHNDLEKIHMNKKISSFKRCNN